MMKQSPTLIVMVGSTLLGGCASPPPSAQFAVTPFAEVRDAKGSPQSHYLLGRQMQRAGRLDDAERAYRHALDLDPTHADSVNGLAAISAARGELDIAIALLEELARDYPDRPHILANLGYAHYLKGNHFDARVALERSLELDPSNTGVRSKLALVLQKTDGHGGAATASDAPAVDSAGPDAKSEPLPQVVELTPGVYALRPSVPDAAVLQSPPATAAATEPPRVVELTGTPPASMASELAVAPPRVREIIAYGRGAGPSLPVEIVNGNGVTGLGRSLRALVAARDWQVVRLANHPQFNVRATRIEYPEERGDAAQRFARELGLEPVFRPLASTQGRIRVVLGQDLRSVAALQQRMAVAVQTAD